MRKRFDKTKKKHRHYVPTQIKASEKRVFMNTLNEKFEEQKNEIYFHYHRDIHS